MPASKTGDWKKAGILLKHLHLTTPILARQKLYDDGEKVLKRLQQHIDEQDLPWLPLKESTVRKKGNQIVYVETRYLRDNLSVRRISAGISGATVFIGASPWKRHKPSGLKFSELMAILEYGRRDGHIPPRPLIRPTYEEVKRMLSSSWAEWLADQVKGLM
jgi:hypothetical protein